MKTEVKKYRSDIDFPLKRVVIKIGSNGVTQNAGGPSPKKIQNIVNDLAWLHKKGIELILISSGAIHTGRPLLDLTNESNIPIETLQACSAVGQPLLMHSYHLKLKQHDITCAQILLTHEDFKQKKRFLNVQNTLLKLLEKRCIPILNENDSVSFEEITLGDNDQLAVMSAQMLRADLLLILSQPDGLYQQNPSRYPDTPLINSLDLNSNFPRKNFRGKSSGGRGGMLHKLDAIKRVVSAGIPTILATHQRKSPILHALKNSVGTFFPANKIKKSSLRAERLWASTKAHCCIKVDQGAYSALISAEKRASLLPIGILKVEGNFSRGDCITLKFSRKSFAVGPSEYSSSEITKLIGKKTHEIASILGYCHSNVIVHSNNLIIKE